MDDTLAAVTPRIYRTLSLDLCGNLAGQPFRRSAGSYEAKAFGAFPLHLFSGTSIRIVRCKVCARSTERGVHLLRMRD